MKIFCKVDGDMCAWIADSVKGHAHGITMVAASLDQAFEGIPQSQRPKVGPILALIVGGKA